jgi:hypothetical protein
MKIPATPKKNKRKEKIPKPIMESLKHINFHLFSKLNGDVHCLIFPLNGPMKGKGGKQAGQLWTNILISRKKRLQKWKNHPKFLVLVDAFCVFVV